MNESERAAGHITTTSAAGAAAGAQSRAAPSNQTNPVHVGRIEKLADSIYEIKQTLDVLVDELDGVSNRLVGTDFDRESTVPATTVGFESHKLTAGGQHRGWSRGSGQLQRLEYEVDALQDAMNGLLAKQRLLLEQL